jgi:magnesium-transporting ATPase (P-type)
VLALLAFGDSLKPGARAAIERLSAMGIKSVLLTGDNAGSAASVAKSLGIAPDAVHAHMLPADKARVIAQLKASAQGAVAMAGDGINDAPALAAADIGIAMATGTDVAMEAAGITLMRGDPALVADAIDIARRTYRKIQQNLFWAFVYNLIGIPLAAFGLLNPMLAGAAMAFSSVSVVTNALLLRTWRAQAGLVPVTADADARGPTASRSRGPHNALLSALSVRQETSLRYGRRCPHRRPPTSRRWLYRREAASVRSPRWAPFPRPRTSPCTSGRAWHRTRAPMPPREPPCLP